MTAARDRRSRSPASLMARLGVGRGARCDARSARRRARQQPRPTASTSWPRRRGGSAGSTTASRPARQAYPRYEELGDRLRAGQCAVWLYEHHAVQGHAGHRRRLAATGPPGAGGATPESIEYGALAAARGRGRPRRRRPRRRAALAPRRARRWAGGCRSPDLEAEALQTIGRVLIDAGELAEGSATSTRRCCSPSRAGCGPYSTGKVYCSLIGACEELGDLRRAAEWTEATLPLVGGPPARHVARASAGSTTPSLLQLRGDWGEAERGGPTGLRRARRLPRAQRRRRLRRDRRHPPPARRPRRRRGGVRRAPRSCAASAAPVWRCSASRSGEVDAAIGHHRAMLARAAPGTGSPAASSCPLRSRSPSPPATSTPRPRPSTELERHRRRLHRARCCRPRRCRRAGGSSSPRATPARRARRCATPFGAGRSSTCPTRWRRPACCSGRRAETCGDEDGASPSFASAAAIFDRLGAHSMPVTSRDLDVAAVAARPGSPPGRPRCCAWSRRGRRTRRSPPALHLSERTVARHLSNIFTKVGRDVAYRAAGFAYEHGLAQPAPATG